PGMVHAAVASTPMIGGRPASIDEASIGGANGVIKVVPLDSAVAVVAEHYWQAQLALERLKVSWQAGPGGSFDDAALDAMYRDALGRDTGWAEAETQGDALERPADPRRVFEAEYRSPWLSHAPIEPMNATVS